MSQYYTGDAVFTSAFAAVVRFPTSQANWVYSCWLAAMYDLSQSYNWATGGETTPDEAAELFNQIFNEDIFVTIVSAGDIKFTANGSPGSNWLPCDGAMYSSLGYPDLYAAIGTTFNTGLEPSGNFRVPDLRGRVLAGVDPASTRLPVWASSIGGTGGESTHTLITGEMPSHSHTDAGHSHTYTTSLTSTADIVPTEPVNIPNPLPGLTGTGNANIQPTGGDGAHNNVQPTMVIPAWILASI